MSRLANKTNRKCRLCLVDADSDKMHDLYTTALSSYNFDDENQGDEFSKLPLNQKVEYCCGVKLMQKHQMPTKICGKCINIINMWSNFRQMCCNSQAFLASQMNVNVTLEENMIANNIKDIQKMRLDILKKTNKEKSEQFHKVQTAPPVDEQLEVDYLVEEITETDFANDYEATNDGDNDGFYESGDDIDNDPNYQPEQRDDKKDISLEYAKLMQESDISETLSPDDYAEALEYLNGEDDDELERIIEQCASTKNSALQTLRRKAAQSTLREKEALKKPPKIKRKPAEPKNAQKDDADKNKLMKPSMFMCNICGNVYSKKPLFQYHMRMHSDVKPYSCEICNKSYRIMSDLKNHMYRHTGERPFKCKFCDRHFMDRSSRHRHERVHTNSRPYSCGVCNKSFTYSAILKNHMKLHTGEKDFICAVCNKSFTLAHQLKAHMLTLTHRQKEAAFEAQGYKVIFEEGVKMNNTN